MKYITSRELKVSCKFEGREASEILSLRKGAVLEKEAETGLYMVVNPTTDTEKRIFMNETTLNGFKSLKAIVSMEAKKALKAASSGNNIELEKRIIDLTNENFELKQLNEELTEEVSRLKATLDNFTTSAANQDGDLNIDESEIPDYESMTLAQLKEIAEDNGLDITGMKKVDIAQALYALHEEDSE